MSFLAFEITFEDLHTPEGLKNLDGLFCDYLKQGNETLAQRLKIFRQSPPGPIDESAFILDLAPYVEDFISKLFLIERDITELQSQTYALAPLYRCKRLFVQRIVAKSFSKEDVQHYNGQQLKENLSELMGEPYSDIRFSVHVLTALASEDNTFLEVAKKFAAWSLYQEKPSILFNLPKKVDPENLIPIQREGNFLTSSYRSKRKNDGISVEKALDQAHYCILCHNQGKDSCSKGLSAQNKGCPLEQKISEMNTLRIQGSSIGALAVIMVDNPMVAATGHRICNDCMKGCIFQKQEAVDIPSIETQTLESVLNLPWGIEIYGLLSRWNPLNLKRPYPLKNTGYKVLIAGMGPAGFTLAHYLLNEGHTVVGIDGLKIEPFERELLEKPIKEWFELKEPHDKRSPVGFGGVAEYGITSRWDKNYLKLVHLLLERRSNFALYDGTRLGSTLTIPQALGLGFDHVALCLGAGRPNILDIPNNLAQGIRTASDFLMSLQLTGATQEKSLANLQIRLPILVVGGGLTAVDTAIEALSYYAVQVEKFLQRTEALGELPDSLSEVETQIAQEFLNHALSARKGDDAFLKNASTIVYRKSFQESPSYRLNAEELKMAMEQGVGFLENSIPYEIKVDEFGHLEALVVKMQDNFRTLPCRTLLIATGTHPNTILEQEDSDLKITGDNFLISYNQSEKISYFGDLHPDYQGNVVKAMASAKKGYPYICQSLLKNPPKPQPGFFKSLNNLLHAYVDSVHRLTPTISEVVIKAPQVAINFQPGQFFRLQNYGRNGIEGLALTGAHADPERGIISLIVLEVGSSSRFCQFLKPKERVTLMGPTGMPTEIPQNETVLLIGGGLGNAVLFSIGHALKKNNNRVLYVAGYKNPNDLFKAEEIETISDHVIWCCESSQGISPRRSQDFSYIGNVVEGLFNYASCSPPISLKEIDRIITIGSDRMMAAISCARKTILKPFLNSGHKAIGSINSPMQCMMKGICGQCIQKIQDPVTGHTRVIFTCAAQDQGLDEIDFDILHDRLQQNSLLEKQTNLWSQKCLSL
ncbi:MAG: FAD-dependent oxidoreductase [Proteobacteria bacterium]|nr:FAD-dependent oxidoreductase [Pseudomonadota bacterium]